VDSPLLFARCMFPPANTSTSWLCLYYHRIHSTLLNDQDAMLNLIHTNPNHAKGIGFLQKLFRILTSGDSVDHLNTLSFLTEARLSNSRQREWMSILHWWF